MSEESLAAVEQVRASAIVGLRPSACEPVRMEDAGSRILAVDVAAPGSLPPHDHAAMDGYAVRAADLTEASPDRPVSLRVIGDAHAGHPSPERVAPGTAVAIATGGVVPDGADAVVRIEDTDGGEEQVAIHVGVTAGHDIRGAGQDVATGDLVLAAGTRLGPTQIALLAGVGVREVSCHRRPRVAVLLTGDEVATTGEPRPGQVHDAVGAALCLLVEDAGGVPTLQGPIADDREVLAAAIAAAAAEHDLVVTVGGVSVGPRDHLAETVGSLGRVKRWRVAVRPGKPFAHGDVAGTRVLCLPGNPTATLVSFELFARPAVLALAGGSAEPDLGAVVTDNIAARPGRLEVLRGTARLEAGRITVTPVTARTGLAALGAADTWILLPPGAAVAAGDPVPVRPIQRRAAWPAS